jgi:hypothetical protein
VTLGSEVNCIESLDMSSAELWNTRRAWGCSVTNERSTREREKYLVLSRGIENRTNHVRRLLTESAAPISWVEYGMAGVCLTGRRPKTERTRGG